MRLAEQPQEEVNHEVFLGSRLEKRKMFIPMKIMQRLGIVRRSMSTLQSTGALTPLPPGARICYVARLWEGTRTSGPLRGLFVPAP